MKMPLRGIGEVIAVSGDSARALLCCSLAIVQWLTLLSDGLCISLRIMLEAQSASILSVQQQLQAGSASMLQTVDSTNAAVLVQLALYDARLLHAQQVIYGRQL